LLGNGDNATPHYNLPRRLIAHKLRWTFTQSEIHRASVNSHGKVASKKNMPTARRIIWFFRKCHWRLNVSTRAAKTAIPVSIQFVLVLVAINLCGSVCSATAKTPSATSEPKPYTDIDSAKVGPSITREPLGQTVIPGQTATFMVGATGSGPLTYQWMLNGAAIAGATSPAYTTPAAALADNGAQFSVTISNPMGNATSSAAMLTVNAVSRPEPSASSISGQDQRVRISRFLSNSYVGLQIGYIGYAYSNSQLLPGFQAQAVQVPHLAGRIVLYGHEFGKYFSVQLSELIPVHTVVYRNVNGDATNHSLWMNNVAGITSKARLPLGKSVSLFGEGGLGIVTRNGFKVNQSTALKSANYLTFLFGGGLDYRLNDNWDLPIGVTVAPGQGAGKQPSTLFFSSGFNYTMRRVPAEPGEADPGNGPLWPRNFIQVGYITNALGYGVNDFFTTGKTRIFWHGTVEVANGLSVEYRRNIFHTRRFFALDWGAGTSSWKSRINGQRFYTASLYPVLRVPLVRTNPFESYFSYSLAGPALITRTDIDGQVTGRKFTFQDFMGIGFYLSRKRRVTGEVRIQHYSNGNLFSQNPGITIPLGFYLGSTF
jgi:opacity protein-like surface antigen